MIRHYLTPTGGLTPAQQKEQEDYQLIVHELVQLGKGAKHEKRTEAAAAAIEARLTTAKLHNFKTRCEVAEIGRAHV